MLKILSTSLLWITIASYANANIYVPDLSSIKDWTDSTALEAVDKSLASVQSEDLTFSPIAADAIQISAIYRIVAKKDFRFDATFIAPSDLGFTAIVNSKIHPASIVSVVEKPDEKTILEFDDHDKFSFAGRFPAHLHAGLNTIEVQYIQKLSQVQRGDDDTDESFKSAVARFAGRFEYILHPLKGWELENDFTLTVRLLNAPANTKIRCLTSSKAKALEGKPLQSGKKFRMEFNKDFPDHLSCQLKDVNLKALNRYVDTGSPLRLLEKWDHLKSATRIVLPDADGDEDELQALKLAQKVRKLELTNKVKSLKRLLPIVSRMSALEEISFGDEISNKEADLGQLAGLQNLRTLTFTEGSWPFKTLKGLSKIQSLRHIEFTGSKLDAGSFEALAGVPHLRSISFIEVNLKGKPLQALSKSRSITKLELDLKVYPLAKSDVSTFSKFRGLKELLIDADPKDYKGWTNQIKQQSPAIKKIVIDFIRK